MMKETKKARYIFAEEERPLLEKLRLLLSLLLEPAEKMALPYPDAISTTAIPARISTAQASRGCFKISNGET